MVKHSVIIPTYNGASKIASTLSSLERQSFKSFEVIIVVDGSTDDTVNRLKLRKYDFASFEIVVRDNGGRAAARNTGARSARGEVLIFFDDDVRLSENCVAAHAEHHDVILNSVLAGNVYEDPGMMKTDIQRFRCARSRQHLKILGDRKLCLAKENLFLSAANFSIPRAVFECLGGFDERLMDSEDFDLAVRAFKERFTVYFDPNLAAWHDDFITCRSYIKRYRDYTTSHEKLMLLKPELYSEFNERQIKPLRGLKRKLFSLFAHGFWIDMVDNFNWLMILPRPMRYRIYSYIIASRGSYFPNEPIFKAQAPRSG